MSNTPFSMTFTVGWSDVDPNWHLRNSAFLDLATNVRFGYFAAQGYAQEAFTREGVAPIVFRDEINYLREVRLFEAVTVNLWLGGLSPDGSRWKLWQELSKEAKDGAVPVAQTVAHGAWLNMKTRKLATPPDLLAEVMRSLPHAENFDAGYSGQ